MKVGIGAGVHAEPGNGADIGQDKIDSLCRLCLIRGVENLPESSSESADFVKIALACFPSRPAPLALVVGLQKVCNVLRSRQRILV